MRQRQPDSIRVQYFRELRLMLKVARELVRLRVFPLLPELLYRAREQRGDVYDLVDDSTTGYDSGLRFDAKQPAERRINTKMTSIEEAFWRKFPNERLEKLGRAIATRTSDFQRAQLFKQVRETLGADPGLREPKLKARIAAFTAENVALIKSVPQRYLEDVEKRIISGMRTGARHEDIAKELQERYDVSESRAKLIARDQVGKFYGELNGMRQKALGIERFIWRTAGDNRVRDEHEALDGEEFTWEDGAPGEGFPGEPIQCRCSADPVIDDED